MKAWDKKPSPDSHLDSDDRITVNCPNSQLRSKSTTQIQPNKEVLITGQLLLPTPVGCELVPID